MQKLIFMAVLLSFNIANAEFRFTNPSHTTDYWIAPDKGNHFLGGAASTAITTIAFNAFNDKPMSTKNIRNIAIANSIAWLAWEIKDGAISFEEHGRTIGGDGFSYKDLIWSMAGVALITAINLLSK